MPKQFKFNENLIGTKKGRLTLIEFLGIRELYKRNTPFIRCKCECGNFVEISLYDFNRTTNKVRKSCGCLQRGVTGFKSSRTTDMEEKKFGKLTVKSFYKDPNRKNKHVSLWLCECECGNTSIVDRNDLLKGKVKSCGCSHHEKRVNRDLRDQVFGRLRPYEKFYKDGHAFWKCECTCGNNTNVRENNLLNKHTMSCGCMNSKAETRIIDFLNKNNISFKSQFSFNDLRKTLPLRFDFKININDNDYFLLEFFGSQHYKPMKYWKDKEFQILKESDNMKKEYCSKNNIKLEILDYTVYKTLEIELEKLLRQYNLI